ncbi:MAG: helix-turn-helix domain-containing protein [Clostridia bacterium]|nr:helix-turn-helix domain-containing protein [Clostridia bacterium]
MDEEFDYYSLLFKEYPDVVKMRDLKKMLRKIGKNKLYKLLRDEKIYSKKIGRDYYIPKVSVIKYLIEN